jgi:N-methylhydantoinase B
MTVTTDSLDPITFEVIKHRLWQINDEQAIAIKTISASPIVVEGNDFNVGLFTAEGELVTAGFGSSVHVGTMGTTIRNIIKKASRIREGDIFLINDPYLGTLHHNDVIIASPLFEEGEIVLWIGNVLHHPDVGGIDEGSFCINARNAFQEPPRYFFKITDNGHFSTELEHTFITNSRLPDMVALDLRAQIAAIYVAKDRLASLIADYGSGLVRHVMKATLTVAATAIRKHLGSMVDGSWDGTAWMDGTRVGLKDIVGVHLRLTKKDDRLIFNYEGSDPQVDAAVNCTYHATVSGSAVPIYSFLCRGEIDWNDGVLNAMEVIAPEGTVVNAQFPAPVSICSVGFRWLVTVAATQAIARMFNSNPEYRHLACPSWNVSSNCNNLFAFTPEGKRVGALLSDHRAGGAAARTFADGFSHAGQVTSFMSNLGNVESTEWKLPLLYLFRRQLEDSGGPGKFRGGLTAESAVVPFGVNKVLYKSTNTAGTIQSNAAGLSGGYPGGGSQVITYRDSGVQKALSIGQIPHARENLGGRLTYLPSKADGDLTPDDVFVFYAPGGGGYGDPLLRDTKAVANDVKNRWVSRQRAEQSYGVVISDDDSVDEIATEQTRTKLVERRRQSATKAHKSPIQGLNCSCGNNDDFYMLKTDLVTAGPWLAVATDGVSDEFHIEEHLCAHCHTLVDVHEVRTQQYERKL